MAKVTRRGFLQKTSAGAAALGALTAVPAAALAAGQSPVSEAPAAEMGAAESFVVYVRNPAAGELSLLVGSQEIAHTDRALAARLWQIAAAGHKASDRAAHSTKG